MRLLLGLLILLLPLAAAPARALPATPPPVILVSIDGVRPDYLDRGVTPHLTALRAQGASGALLPAFPAKTFPNHYAIATGKAPDRNGITGNSMIDPARPGQMFSLADPRQALDPFWWREAEPIWITAERAGLRTATMFWPGSEVAHGALRPTDWMRYDQNISNAQRVRTVLDWLRRPPSSRPHFITLYFDSVDTAGHRFGPDSPEVNAALAEVDGQIGVLRAGITEYGITANLVILSDHGMARTQEANTVQLGELIDPAAMIAVEVGPYAAIEPVAGTDDRVFAALIGKHAHVECRRAADWTKALDFGRHPRAAAIYCLADPGWQVIAGPSPYPLTGGAHGWPVAAMPEMQALFVAHGPNIRPGRVAPVANVEVYPLVARLLGMAPLPGDAKGTLADQVAKKD